MTIAHYSRRAASYCTGTRTIDPAAWIDAFLLALPTGRRLRLLDLGCGPGRDLAALCKRGHDAVGLDGAPEMVELARCATGTDVMQQDMLTLDLEGEHYDGVFANASLFHVPRSQLTRVLGDIHTALTAHGVLFLRVPLGDDHEDRAPRGAHTGRYACFLRASSWVTHLAEAGFEPLGSGINSPPSSIGPWFEALFQRRR